jgi:hypothetical protein
MADRKLPAATRRLDAILSDDEYGPKLVRLNRGQQRVVLDLIYDNKMRDAKKQIESLDASRRRRRSLREKARDYAKLPKRQRSAEWQEVMEDVEKHEAEFWQLYKMAKAA